MPAEDALPFGDKFEIRVDDHAVAVYRRGTDELQWRIEWGVLEEIIAWKADLFAVDCICMGFAWRGSNVLKAVDEEMAGWNELQAAIERRLGVKESAWWSNVAFPAFVENRTVVWKRAVDAAER